jgi:hypothetical protein
MGRELLETALYFPYIRVPETSWFTQVLLYWDGAASIIPANMFNYEERIGKYMRELIDAHLVYPVQPAMAHYDSGFKDNFLAQLDSYNLPTITESGHWARLHHEKIGYGIFQELETRGLAKALDDDGGYVEWFAVEERTAELFMDYLVGWLCRTDRDMHLFPVTDTSSQLRRMSEPLGAPARPLARMRYATITQALPVPSRAVSPTELARFKDQHHDELRRLRCYLNDQLVDLAETEDGERRDAKLESLIQNIRDDVEVLTERMTQRRWPRIVLVGVAGLVASGAAIGAAIATGGTALALGLGITAGTASMGPSAYQATDIFRSRRFDPRAPLAYAALAQDL